MSQATIAIQDGAPPPRRRRLFRYAALAVLVLLLGGLVFAGFKYTQWTAEPSYWQENSKMLAMLPAEQKRERADTFLGRFGKEWSAFGEAQSTQDLIESPDAADRVLGDTRTIIIPYDDLNILLEVELPAILESQGMPLPDSVKGIMVTSDGRGRIIVAFEYDAPKLKQVFSLTLEVSATPAGIITSNLVAARGGELTLPRAQALDRIGEIIGGDREWGEIRLMKLFTGQPFGPMDVPIDPGDDGIRNGRITGIEVHDDAIHLTRTTVARRPRADATPDAPQPRIEIDE
ncbi:MAG: hypothetical protein ACIAXF_08670 [Phycisphaerales bacterium JB063]